MVAARRILIFVALWLLFEGVISWFATCESAYQPSGYGSGKQAKEYCSAFSGPVLASGWGFLYWLGHILEGYGEAVIAVFTIVLAFAAGLLWKATRDLVRSAESTAERQLRAYVSIFSGRINYTNIIDAQTGTVAPGAQVLVELRNSGQTPAHQFTTWIAQPVLLDKDATPWGERGEESKRTSILGSQVANGLEKTFHLSDEDRIALNKGAKKIFVWGGADYKDAFGRKRFYKFRATNNSTSVMHLGGFWGLTAEGEEGD